MTDTADPSTTTLALPGARATTLAWQEGWGELPPPPDPAAWAHPGLVIAPDGSVLVADTAAPVVHRLDGVSGTLLGSTPLPTTEVHGLAIEPGAADETLWVADQGVRLRVEGGETVRTGPWAGRVIRGVLAGGVAPGDEGAWDAVETPRHDVYRDKPYRPTFVAFDPASDDVWIADGYGGHVVHRYGRDGAYRATIGAGQGEPFDTPHGVWVDRRGREPRLLVADRGNRRILAFDLDGQRIGEIGAGRLTSPSGIVGYGEVALVAELHGALAVLDPDDAVAGHLGQGDLPTERDGWPNQRRADGSLGRPAMVPGRFHAPHAIDVAVDGSILVAEFVVGGRLVRLAPTA